MAFQEMEILPSDIVPQKTLNNIESMYHYLKQKLNDAKQITDLIPFVKKLINIKDLKQTLKSSLDKQYQTAKKNESQSSNITNTSQSANNIRSLFVSLFSLNGIPSDNIHAHILSFLPSVEYKKLSLLSKHFKFICKNYHYLYNDMGYIVQLKFSIAPERLSKTSTTSINVYHTGSAGIYISAMDKKHPSKLSSDDINNLTVPITQIKKWAFVEEYVWRDPDESMSMDATQDGNNQIINNLISTHSNKIEKLEVQLTKKNISDNVFNVYNQFNQCKILSITDAKDVSLSPNTFKNLQCLEITTSDDFFGAEMTLKNVNGILKSITSNLTCLQYKFTKPTFRIHRNRSMSMDIENCDEICIPSQIEWLSIETVGRDNVSLDLSECNKLIGVQLMGIDYDKVKWPKDKTRTIPFVCIGIKHRDEDRLSQIGMSNSIDDEKSMNEWKNKIMRKQLDVKVVCILREEEVTEQDETPPPAWDNDRRYKWVYDDDEKMKKVNVIRAFDDEKKKNEEKCLLLGKDSCNDMLFGRILEYVVRDDNKRNKMLKRCERWWYLGSAQWLKNIAGCEMKT